MKSLIAAAGLMAAASPALAQDTAPWDLRDRNAYVMDMQGKMWSTRVGDKGMAMMMRNAKALPRGTVIWQSNGRLYMARAGMWDRAGNFMAMGGYCALRPCPEPGPPHRGPPCRQADATSGRSG
jgi:hypothetical protein